MPVNKKKGTKRKAPSLYHFAVMQPVTSAVNMRRFHGEKIKPIHCTSLQTLVIQQLVAIL